MTDESQDVWRPHGVRDDDALCKAYDTLVEGVPSWLEPSLYGWVKQAVNTTGGVLDLLDRRLRITIKKSYQQYSDDSKLFNYWHQADDDARLRMVDALIYFRHQRMLDAAGRGNSDASKRESEAVISLSEMLTEAGSAWTVGGTAHWSLVRRVNATLQAQVNLVVSAETDSARKIASAWHDCYKMDPDPDHAYRDAVLAVEALLLNSTTPGGTLGTAVAHVRDTVSKWSVGGLDDPKRPSGETLLAMLQTLWHNQERHANSDGTITGVSQSEAEAAVSLAVTLVHWFSAGLVLKDGVAT